MKLEACNTSAPINRLPVEVLIEVMNQRLIVEDNTIYDHYKKLQLLAGVCRHWKTLVFETPLFWTTIEGYRSLRLMALALQRSAQLPLSLTFYYGNGRAILDMASHHVRRWRSLGLRCDELGGIPELERCLNKPAPMLERLHLSGNDHHSADFFAGKAERLRYVSLQAWTVSWESNALSDLHTLDIGNIHLHGPTLTQLFNVLTSCPELRSLCLEAVKLAPGPSPPPSEGPLSLATLRKLSLKELAIQELDVILRHLRVPQCISLEITQGLMQQSDLPRFNGFLGDSMQHLSSYIFNAVKNAARLQLEFDTGRNQFEVNVDMWTEDQPLALTLPLPDAPRTLLWICTPHSFSSIETSTEVVISSEGGVESPGQFGVIEESLGILDTTVEELVVNAPLSLTRAILAFLRLPQSRNGVLHWPLPNLKILGIRLARMDTEEITDMLDSRYGKGRGSKKKVLPCPLSKFILQGPVSIDARDYYNIKATVGADVFYDETEEEKDAHYNDFI